jgi:hypothetical protein
MSITRYRIGCGASAGNAGCADRGRETRARRGDPMSATPRVGVLTAVAATLVATAALAAADRVPAFNVEPICRDVARRAAPVGTMDTCMRNEQAARDELVHEWARFAPADKSHCLALSTLGGEPTYTELLTCLEVARDARSAKEQDERSARPQRRHAVSD